MFETQLEEFEIQILTAPDSATRSSIGRDKAVALQQLRSTREMIQLNLDKRSNQEILSPIAGSVVTWQPKQRLAEFPVKPNDILMTIAKLDGPWQLEVKIPQNKIDYIRKAREKDGGPLKVEFAIGTNANDTFYGTLDRVSLRSHPDDSGVPQFQGIVNVYLEDEIRELLHHGATVTAKIHCGTVPLHKNCFYQVTDWLKTSLFWVY